MLLKNTYKTGPQPLPTTNKNNPARISAEDSEKMLELLLSLALYYTEYLYLRVVILSVGGRYRWRIGSNQGYRSIAVERHQYRTRQPLPTDGAQQIGYQQLSYPVFDKTD